MLEKSRLIRRAVQRQPPRFLGRLALNDRELNARSRQRETLCGGTGTNPLGLAAHSHQSSRTRAAAEQRIEAVLLVA